MFAKSRLLHIISFLLYDNGSQALAHLHYYLLWPIEKCHCQHTHTHTTDSTYAGCKCASHTYKKKGSCKQSFGFQIVFQDLVVVVSSSSSTSSLQSIFCGDAWIYQRPNHFNFNNINIIYVRCSEVSVARLTFACRCYLKMTFRWLMIHSSFDRTNTENECESERARERTKRGVRVHLFLVRCDQWSNEAWIERNKIKNTISFKFWHCMSYLVHICDARAFNE